MTDLTRYAGIRLDIGCGGDRKQPGFVGMDKQALPDVDVVHDWNVFPWPFDDESVLIAVATHVVEHVSPIDGHFLRWMDELWRIMKFDGEVCIVTPHGRSEGYLQDPTHCNPCSERTWAYFDPESFDGGVWKIYRPKPWKIKHVEWSLEHNIEVVLIKRGLPDE
jgi:hypothetical protein